MPCYSPLTGWMSKHKNEYGNHYVVFKSNLGQQGSKLKLPCSQCIGCRLEYSRQWAMRISHEASLRTHNYFLTLTYDEKHLPKDFSVSKREMQLFLKRLRKWASPTQLRFFACGEYGEKFGRAHYHAIIFNLFLFDKVEDSVQNGKTYYQSQKLNSIWQNGNVLISDVTFESAAYVARYATKKINGEKAQSHYEKIIESTGEILTMKPEFALMSRRPGIGQNWRNKYKGDLEKDFITMRGTKMKPPKYYDNQLKLESPEVHEQIKLNRKTQAIKLQADNTKQRLLVRKKIKEFKINSLKRSLHEN